MSQLPLGLVGLFNSWRCPGSLAHVPILWPTSFASESDSVFDEISETPVLPTRSPLNSTFFETAQLGDASHRLGTDATENLSRTLLLAQRAMKEANLARMMLEKAPGRI